MDVEEVEEGEQGEEDIGEEDEEEEVLESERRRDLGQLTLRQDEVQGFGEVRVPLDGSGLRARAGGPGAVDFNSTYARSLPLSRRLCEKLR